MKKIFLAISLISLFGITSKMMCFSADPTCSNKPNGTKCSYGVCKNGYCTFI